MFWYLFCSVVSSVLTIFAMSLFRAENTIYAEGHDDGIEEGAEMQRMELRKWIKENYDPYDDTVDAEELIEYLGGQYRELLE